MAIANLIKYNADNGDALVYKFIKDDIRLGSQLIVNESQEALFFKGGKALNLFGPGTHTLKTGNLPLIDKVVNFAFGGETPFSAEVWFVNKTVKRNIKWNTPGPIQVIDSIYNYPVNIRAFGSYGIRISESRKFITQIVGVTAASYYKNYISLQKVQEYFSSEIIQKLSDALTKYFVEKNISAFQVNAKINELSNFIHKDISQEFERFGIKIVNFNIERISIPEKDMEKFQDILGRKMEINEISKAKAGQAYTTMRSFDTMEKLAQNEGGGAAAANMTGM